MEPNILQFLLFLLLAVSICLLVRQEDVLGTSGEDACKEDPNNDVCTEYIQELADQHFQK